MKTPLKCLSIMFTTTLVVLSTNDLAASPPTVHLFKNISSQLPKRDHSKVKAIIDDLSNPHPQSALGTSWRFVSDTVMGGISSGSISREDVDGRKALRLTGNVSLENNGGFVQMVLQLNSKNDNIDPSGYKGIELLVRGNNEPYSLHLRTLDLERPWQSYRQKFIAKDKWAVIKLAFNNFEQYRTEKKLDLSKLRRLGVVAIGKEFSADISVAGISFY